MAAEKFVCSCTDCTAGGYPDFEVAFLRGEIDAHTFEKFEKQFNEVISPGAKYLLDCSELSYINSAGIGLLISRLSDCKEIVLANLQAEVKETLNTLGFLTLFDVVEVTVFEKIEEKLELNISPASENLKPTRERVRNLLEIYNDDTQQIHHVVMALDEALHNVMEHALDFDREKNIELTLELYENGVIIRIQNEGPDFDPVSEEFSIEEFVADNRKRGLGLYFINELLDKVSYQVTPEGKNYVRLEKFFDCQ